VLTSGVDGSSRVPVDAKVNEKLGVKAGIECRNMEGTSVGSGGILGRPTGVSSGEE
jgi:hypothetical protein